MNTNKSSPTVAKIFRQINDRPPIHCHFKRDGLLGSMSQ